MLGVVFAEEWVIVAQGRSAARDLHAVDQDRTHSFRTVVVGVGAHGLNPLEHVPEVARDGDFLHRDTRFRHFPPSSPRRRANNRRSRSSRPAPSARSQTGHGRAS